MKQFLKRALLATLGHGGPVLARLPGGVAALNCLIPYVLDPRVIRNEAVPKKLHGLPLKVLANPYTAIHRSVFFYGKVYETHTLRFLQRYLRPGSTFVDVGMNYGHFSVIGAYLVGDSGRVYAFEPNADLCFSVAANAKMNLLDSRIVIHNCALGSKDGELTLTVPHDDGGAFLGANSESSGRAGIGRLVAVRVGDDELSGLDKKDALVIKVDVEGAELDVLVGLSKTLIATRAIMQVEVTPGWLGSERLARLAELVHALGYDCFDSMTLRPVKLLSLKDQTDVIMLPS